MQEGDSLGRQEIMKNERITKLILTTNHAKLASQARHEMGAQTGCSLREAWSRTNEEA